MYTTVIHLGYPPREAMYTPVIHPGIPTQEGYVHHCYTPWYTHPGRHIPTVIPPGIPTKGSIPPIYTLWYTHHGRHTSYTPCGIPTMGGIPLYTHPEVYPGYEALGSLFRLFLLLMRQAGIRRGLSTVLTVLRN